MKTDTLIITGGVVALLLSVGVSALFFCLPLINSEAETTWAEAGVLGAPGLVGALSAGATFYSARHEGRWGWVGLALGLAFLVLTVATVLVIVTLPYYGPLAMFVFALAVVNVVRSDSRRRSS